MMITWILLLYIQTFAEMTGYKEGVFYVLGTSVLTVIKTVFYGAFLFFWADHTASDCEGGAHVQGRSKAHRRGSGNLNSSLLAVSILSGICLFSAAASGWCGWLDFFGGSTYMKLFGISINKKYLFDMITFCVFPFWSAFLIRGVKQSAYAAGAAASAIVQILILTIIGFALYMRLSKIWLIDMAFMNVAAIVAAIRIYIWKDAERKGNILVLILGYAFVWIALISMSYSSGQTAADFITGSSTAFDASLSYSYINNVRMIWQNASFAGPSNVLNSNPYVLDFMNHRRNPLLAALFYTGWLGGLAVILLEIIFITAAAFVVIRYRSRKGTDTMLWIVWLSLAIRAAAGILYSAGIPIPFSLPFSGQIGLMADSIAVGFLILAVLNQTVGNWLKQQFDIGLCGDLDDEMEEESNEKEQED